MLSTPCWIPRNTMDSRMALPQAKLCGSRDSTSGADPSGGGETLFELEGVSRGCGSCTGLVGCCADETQVNNVMARTSRIITVPEMLKSGCALYPAMPT